MKRIILALCAAALLAGCSTGSGNGKPTIFEGRFIGYNGEFVEFFLPADGGEFLEIPLNVQPDGTFCDTIQFSKNWYDAPLFADRFMFRISVEQGKTYHAEFDITEEGVENNFRFIGEGAAENEFMKHYWSIEEASLLSPAKTFKENRELLRQAYDPLREELAASGNKGFEKYFTNEMAEKENLYAYYFPFFAAEITGACPQDADFDAFVAKQKKLSDEEFSSKTGAILSYIPYFCKTLNITEALKAAAGCSVKPAQKEIAMATILQAFISAGNNNGLAEGYEYFTRNVTNEEYLDNAEEICRNALLLAPGSEAPDIEFEDPDGKIHHLSDFAGKPVYVDLWASWCGPCCEEIPHLQKFVDSMGKDPQIAVISISIDSERTDWTGKLEQLGSSWPQYLATDAGQLCISNQYFVSAIPRFLLINADGTIASVNAPRPSDPDILEELLSLL